MRNLGQRGGTKSNVSANVDLWSFLDDSEPSRRGAGNRAQAAPSVSGSRAPSSDEPPDRRPDAHAPARPTPPPPRHLKLFAVILGLAAVGLLANLADPGSRFSRGHRHRHRHRWRHHGDKSSRHVAHGSDVETGQADVAVRNAESGAKAAPVPSVSVPEWSRSLRGVPETESMPQKTPKTSTVRDAGALFLPQRNTNQEPSSRVPPRRRGVTLLEAMEANQEALRKGAAAARGTGIVVDEASDADIDPLIRYRIVRPEELKGALARMTPGRPVVGTISNLAFSDMLLNWFLNVQHADMVKNTLVAALDQKTLEFCRNHSMPTILLHSDLPSTDFRRSAKKFKEMGTMKTAFVVSVLEQGWDLVMSDTDTVWMRDPSAFFHLLSPLGAADIMVTSDSVSHTNDIESQKHNWRTPVNRDRQGWFRYATPRAREIFGNAYEHAFNTGVLFLRATPACSRFALAWHEVMRTKGRSLNMSRVWGDQHAFNELHRIGMFPIQVYEPEDGSSMNNRIFWTNGRRVKLAVLPVAEFCNGHVFFVQKLHQKSGLRPYVVHNTFQFYYGPGKVARFRQEGLWLLDPPEYYTQGNFLSVNMTLPTWLADLDPGPEKHSTVLKYYYEGLRNAWAIALILNRTLIFPRVTCFCDRYWFTLTEPCRSPGVDQDPPFECPIDHFVDVTYWGTDPAKMPYRPSNFLNRPEVPDEIRASRANIQLVPEGGSLTGGQGVPGLPMLATDEDVWRTLSVDSVRDIRVLHLEDPHRAFCRFTNLKRAAGFDARAFRHFYIEWCCLPGFKPPKWPKFKGMNVTIPLMQNRTAETCKNLGIPYEHLKEVMQD